MVKKGLKITAIAALAIALTACAPNNRQDADVGNNTGIAPQGIDGTRFGVRNRDWDNPRNNNYMSLHNNTRMIISERIADAVADLPEVDSATVLLTEKNAYVAVVLDNGTGYGAAGTGSIVGETRTGDNDDKGDLVNGAVNRLGTVDRMGRRGPTAADHGVTEEVKNNIAGKVKSMEPRLLRVFVSANPDFVNRMRGYGTRFRQGQPIQGVILQFNAMVERMFPDTGTDRNLNNGF